jgi:hypothetical protein
MKLLCGKFAQAIHNSQIPTHLSNWTAKPHEHLIAFNSPAHNSQDRPIWAGPPRANSNRATYERTNHREEMRELPSLLSGPE